MARRSGRDGRVEKLNEVEPRTHLTSSTRAALSRNAAAVIAGPMNGNRAPAMIESLAQLEQLLSEPSEAVVEMMRRVSGDIILLGVGGKIGPSLARMAKRGSELA